MEETGRWHLPSSLQLEIAKNLENELSSEVVSSSSVYNGRVPRFFKLFADGSNLLEINPVDTDNQPLENLHIHNPIVLSILVAGLVGITLTIIITISLCILSREANRKLSKSKNASLSPPSPSSKVFTQPLVASTKRITTVPVCQSSQNSESTDLQINSSTERQTTTDEHKPKHAVIDMEQPSILRFTKETSV